MSVRSTARGEAGTRGHLTVSSCLESVLFTFLLGMIAIILAAASASGSGARSSGECQVSEKYPARVLRWCGLITTYAGEANLPPDLIAAVILQESGGNSNAISHSGAVGLMQIMPRDGAAAQFDCPAGPCFANRPASHELWDPEYNIQYGTRLLRELLDQSNGDLRAALKSYGPYDVGYAYADAVLAIYQKYSQS